MRTLIYIKMITHFTFTACLYHFQNNVFLLYYIVCLENKLNTVYFRSDLIDVHANQYIHLPII